MLISKILTSSYKPSDFERSLATGFSTFTFASPVLPKTKNSEIGKSMLNPPTHENNTAISWKKTKKKPIRISNKNHDFFLEILLVLIWDN